jgi:hypothetical protein
MDITLEQLEHLGRFVNLVDQKDNDNQRFCLNPTWVVDHAYDMLNSRLLKDSQGLISATVLRRNITKELPKLKAHFSDLMLFLKNSRVCKAVNKDYFFPDITTPNEPALVQALLDNNKRPLVVEFHLPYIPIGLATHLVCHWLASDTQEAAHIQNTQEVWREGFILRHKQNANDLLIIEYHYGKSLLFAYCIGHADNIAALLNRFWQILLREIKPIKEENVLSLMSIGQDFLQFNKNLLDNKPNLAGFVEKVTTGNTIVTTNNFHGQIINSPIATGDHSTQTSTYHQENNVETINEHNREQVLLAAIEDFRQEHVELSRQYSSQLSRLQIALEDKQVDESLQAKLVKLTTLPANTATLFGFIKDYLST